jgi:hypothetical protein
VVLTLEHCNQRDLGDFASAIPNVWVLAPPGQSAAGNMARYTVYLIYSWHLSDDLRAYVRRRAAVEDRSVASVIRRLVAEAASAETSERAMGRAPFDCRDIFFSFPRWLAKW